MEYIVIGDGV